MNEASILKAVVIIAYLFVTGAVVILFAAAATMIVEKTRLGEVQGAGGLAFAYWTLLSLLLAVLVSKSMMMFLHLVL